MNPTTWPMWLPVRSDKARYRSEKVGSIKLMEICGTAKRRNLKKGLTLVELLVVVNIVAILAGVASVALSEYGDESRCLEIYTVLPQVIRTQAFYHMRHNQYYAANHNELKDYGVDLSEVSYFTYATFSDEGSSYSARAEATGWARGGWVLYRHDDDDPWDCDDVVIKRWWLPDYKAKKQPPGQAKK